MSELKNCPFCGGAAEHCLGDDGPVICVECNATAAEAADWNCRYTPEHWQMVPQEPTKDMTWIGYNLTSSQQEAAAIYRLMLTEAPKP